MSKQGKAKILAIDDEQVILDSISRLAREDGNWQVDVAQDADEGFARLAAGKYDLILCDIMMPGKDGFALLEFVQQRDIDTPVIITTGYSTLDMAVRSLYNGAIYFLPKPFTCDELLSALDRGLQYATILKTKRQSAIPKAQPDARINYIPCPAKYFRLGYEAWAYHEDDGTIRIGLTDMFIRTIKSPVTVDLLGVDDEIFQGNSCAQIIAANDMTHHVLAPVSGRILQKNLAIEHQPSLIEKDPFFRGWLYVVVPHDLDFEMKYLIPCSSDRL